MGRQRFRDQVIMRSIGKGGESSPLELLMRDNLSLKITSQAIENSKSRVAKCMSGDQDRKNAASTLLILMIE